MKKFYDTLVLNKMWVPVQVVDFRKTINTLYTGSAHALDREYLAYNWEDWINFSIQHEDYPKIHSAKLAIALPEIIVLTKYNRLPTRDIKFSRENVFARDKFCCLYCGKPFTTKQLTIDHIIPRSKGGLTRWDNVATACKSCNCRKDNKTLSEAHMTLRKKPVKPHWMNPVTGARGKAQICPSWSKFMDRVDVSEEKSKNLPNNFMKRCLR